MKALLISGLVALALVGCASTPQNPPPAPPKHQNAPQHHHQNAPQHHHHNATSSFICDNDAKPVIRQLNENQIELIVDDERTIMNAAVSGSGERYVSKTGVYGKGGEWHQKGGEAIFTYYDVGSPAKCRMR